MTTYRSCWMNEDLDALRELARAFFEKEVAPNVDKYIEQHHVDRDLWNKAGELGLLCLSIPEEYGGGGGTFAHEAVLIEEQARVVDTAWGQSLHNGIVAHYLLAYGTEEQKQQWLPKMASGEVVGAIAMTEPGTGSDLQNVKTKAIRDGDEYIVNGSKTFITNGAQADLIIVVVKTDTSQGASGISLVLVEADRPGFRRGRVLDKIGQKGQDTSELFFEDVRIPVSNLLGTAEGQGFIQLMQQLPQERLIIAVGSVAGMEVALEHTLRYTKEREAFGRSVFGFQNTKFKLAEVATEAKIARVFTDDCIAKHIAGELDIPTVAMAKWWTTERAMSVASECLQLHGGYGYMTEYPISRMWVDNRVQMIYAGTNEIMKEIIARSL
ncbi:acyl-CoA dehydrogenase family protein [Nocardia cyriacigeorgica]|jgi:acyl-CoA dehydrogenase|uniref:Acyl-CoA dehydrogenase n=1 Tax=Nocardia cyriacigeorgica TaxID=135487 RepID=A0A2L2JT43_9NOCA|nr:acyl-CoA dehydrogenase family protein [Nocardia cyriacigeorgica]AVH23004.1 acyl-CoA dehydrogenase [Nocardia cyriacigeorgica]MBF6097081.1 acyl-CoA dehydrogenase family protein [Nocardia cyriacigeorgica]MBF6158555.1 acyl-CoA dehydrogenase family protein [Nocardia cyriacigeorgica]MBF6197757.1 acyl-CoA dehydrogenase family protein [Nocardia cyriacigeorgica]MBF6316617.1 acyl-CoA dehydrogenase family protein [Nocardia cyriacigeorgica]